jgi:hypothetical protein
MASDKSRSERRQAEHEPHRKIRSKIDLDINIAKIRTRMAARDLLRAQRVRATYFLCSMLTLWVKMPKEKSNMPAVENYVRRSLNGK